MDKDLPGLVTRGTMDLIGRELKTIRGRGRGEVPLARRRRGIGGGGGESGNRSIFAIVVTAATANGAASGTAILLDNDMQPTVIVDVGDPGYDAGAVDDAKVTFFSAHKFAPCPVGARVRLSSERPITPGAPLDADHKIYGELVDVVDYLATLGGFGANKALVGGSAASNIHWDGTTCPPPE